MSRAAFNTQKRYQNLFDAIAADQARSLDAASALSRKSFDLGPSVGDDLAPAPGATTLGPSVGDDLAPAPGTTALGPSVGDDLAPAPGTTALGPSVGDDLAPAPAFTAR
jgi:hypothetical protein